MKTGEKVIALAALTVLGALVAPLVAAAMAEIDSEQDVLVVRYAILIGGRAGTDAPTSADVLSREELSDFLLEWEPGVDNREVRDVFALNRLGELARQATQLPAAGGSVSGVYVHGDASFEIDMNIQPARSIEGGDLVYTVQAEVKRNGETVAGPLIHTQLGERVVTTSGGKEGDEFLFLVVEIDRMSADELRRRGLRYAWKTDYKIVDGEDVTAPVAVEKVQPLYSEKAREEKIQGRVVLRMVINEKGTVEDVEVIEGQPYGLTESAVDAARQWRFEPAQYKGEPVAVFFLVTINFRLE